MKTVGERYRLKDVVWELTLRCNMACHHCGSNALDPRQDELTPDQIRDIAHQLADVPILRLCLSGGEPLLNPIWSEVVRTVTSRGTAMSIITNGLALAQEDTFDEFCRLREQGHHVTISVSLDGLRNTHNMIRGIDCFDRAIQGVKRMREAGFYCMVQSTANRKNIDELEALRAFLFYDLKPSGWQMQVLGGYGRVGSAREWLLTLEQFKWLSDFWDETYHRAEAEALDLVVSATNCMGYYNNLYAAKWQGCPAGVTGLSIDSNGNVRGCLSLRDNSFIEGSLKEHPLLHLWQRQRSFRYNREFTPKSLNGYCAECEWGPQCRGGCTFMAHSILGNPWEQPYCTWLESLYQLDDDLVRIRQQMPDTRPKLEETWANPAPDVVRLRKQLHENEEKRITGQRQKEERIYEVFDLRSATPRAIQKAPRLHSY